MSLQLPGGGMVHAHLTIMHARMACLIKELKEKVEWDHTCVFRKFICMSEWKVLEWIRIGAKEETAVVCMRCSH